MDHLRDQPRDGCTVVYVNAQDLSHPANLFESILDAFYDDHPDFVRDNLAKGWDLLKKALGAVGGIEFLEFKIALRQSDADWREDWRGHGEKFLKALRSTECRVILIVDELPDMLLNMRDKDPELFKGFLGWFRTQRTDPKPKQDSIRWLVGGSVNLSSTLDQMQLVDRINDLEDIPLPILSGDQVCEFVKIMLGGRGVDFEAELPEQVFRHLGRPVPLFLQMVTQDLYRLWRKEKRRLTVTDVDDIFNALIKSNQARDKLQHYYSRIGKYYRQNQVGAAHALLGMLSGSAAPLSRKQLFERYEQACVESGEEAPGYERSRLFNQLLRDLENDFYVDEVAEDLYDFTSGVMKLWWRKYYA
jgi:hypothetical protein